MFEALRTPSQGSEARLALLQRAKELLGIQASKDLVGLIDREADLLKR